MADELEMLTVNAALNSWVDGTPGAVSTGYQAQNTNIEAHRNGYDRSSLRWDAGLSKLILEVSGVIDENGLPFVCTTELQLTLSTVGVNYIELIAGSDTTHRSAQLTAGPGTWDESKNGYYNGSGFRVLDWEIEYGGSGTTPNIYRRMQESSEKGLKIKDFKIGTSIDRNSFDGLILPSSGVTYWGFSSPNLANSSGVFPSQFVGVNFFDNSSSFAAFANKGVIYLDSGFLLYAFTSSNEMMIGITIVPKFAYNTGTMICILDSRSFSASNDDAWLFYYDTDSKFKLLVQDDSSNYIALTTPAFASDGALQIRHTFFIKISKANNNADVWVNGVKIVNGVYGVKTVGASGITNINIAKTYLSIGGNAYPAAGVSTLQYSLFYVQSLLIANSYGETYLTNYDGTSDKYYYESDFIRGINYNSLLDKYSNAGFNNVSVKNIYLHGNIMGGIKEITSTNHINSSSVTAGDCYSKLAPFIPTVSSKVYDVHGVLRVTGNTLNIVGAYRSSATEIRLYFMTDAGIFNYYSVTLGSSTTIGALLGW